MHSIQIIPALAVAVAVCAAISDVKERRIPNLLTYPALAAGVALQGVLHGWRGLLLGLGGGLLCHVSIDVFDRLSWRRPGHFLYGGFRPNC